MNHMGRTSKGPSQPLKKPDDLQAGEWTIVQNEHAFYLRIDPAKSLDDYKSPRRSDRAESSSRAIVRTWSFVMSQQRTFITTASISTASAATCGTRTSRRSSVATTDSAPTTIVSRLSTALLRSVTRPAFATPGTASPTIGGFGSKIVWASIFSCSTRGLRVRRRRRRIGTRSRTASSFLPRPRAWESTAQRTGRAVQPGTRQRAGASHPSTGPVSHCLTFDRNGQPVDVARSKHQCHGRVRSSSEFDRRRRTEAGHLTDGGCRLAGRPQLVRRAAAGPR